MKGAKLPTLEMSVRVSDGSYESRFSIPVDASAKQINLVAEMWIDALRKAIEVTR